MESRRKFASGKSGVQASVKISLEEPKHQSPHQISVLCYALAAGVQSGGQEGEGQRSMDGAMPAAHKFYIREIMYNRNYCRIPYLH